jgi:hypothetical protein
VGGWRQKKKKRRQRQKPFGGLVSS